MGLYIYISPLEGKIDASEIYIRSVRWKIERDEWK